MMHGQKNIKLRFVIIGRCTTTQFEHTEGTDIHVDMRC